MLSGGQTTLQRMIHNIRLLPVIWTKLKRTQFTFSRILSQLNWSSKNFRTRSRFRMSGFRNWTDKGSFVQGKQALITFHSHRHNSDDTLWYTSTSKISFPKWFLDNVIYIIFINIFFAVVFSINIHSKI